MDAVVNHQSSPLGIIIFGVICCSIFLYIFISLFSNKKDNQIEDSEEEVIDDEAEDIEETTVHQKSARQKLVKKVYKAQKHQFSSPDLQTSFKGHVSPITSGAISLNGKGLTTASEDRTLFFYNLHDAFNKDLQSMQGCRTNLPYDHVKKMCWSPDYNAVVVQMANSESIDVLKGTKKPDGTLGNLIKVRQFEKLFPERLVGLSVANNGRFIMTCDCNNKLSLWNLKGELLSSVTTRQGHTIHATVSINSRFIATSGFTPDVMVFEVMYDKSDNFQALKKSFELVGHNARIFGSDFSTDCGKMATVSKDGTWKLFNTSGDYSPDEGHQPKLLITGSVPEARTVKDEQPCLVRLSPDQRIVLLTVHNTVLCYSSTSARLVHSIENIYAGHIVSVFFDAGSRFFITLGDHQAHLFHNVAGYLATVQDLETLLKEATYSGMRERVKTQLDSAKKALSKIERRGERSKKGTDSKKKK